ncbi:hypothetical protein Hanom_Chr07g00592781 [Helianthus anomalus]
MGVLGEFKRGVDVAHGDWFGVREGTHLLGEHPFTLNNFKFLPTLTYYLLYYFMINIYNTLGFNVNKQVRIIG